MPAMQRLLGFILVLVQGMGIPLVAGLFICAVTGELRQQRLTLEWPQLPDSNTPSVELLLLSLPCILAYVGLAGLLHKPLWRAASFVLLAGLAAYFNSAVFAQAFGNTWTQSEIFFGLMLQHLHLLAMALLPGLLLWWLVGALGTAVGRRLAQV